MTPEEGRAWIAANHDWAFSDDEEDDALSDCVYT